MRKFGLLLLGVTALLTLGSTVYAGMHEEEDMDNKFSIHGEVRFRGEAWSNMTDFTDTQSTGPTTFGTNRADDDFDIFPFRVRIMAKGDLGHDIWVGAEFQSTGVMGGGVSGAESFLFGDHLEVAESNTSLYQGWVKWKDVGDSVLDLTFGRQQIAFDTGLHFSDLSFYNGISHDAVMAGWDWEDFGIHAFWARNREFNLDLSGGLTCFSTNVFGFGGLCTGDDGDQDTMGIHFKHMLGDDKNQDVAYYLFYSTSNQPGSRSIYGGMGNADVQRGTQYTLGGRWGQHAGDDGGWNWNAEAAIQSGDYQPLYFGGVIMPNVYGGNCTIDPNNFGQTCDQSGFVFEGSLGYTWSNNDIDQTLWGGVTFASGDNDPNDKDQDAYMPLYTDFHKRLGYADMWAESNIQAYNIGYKVKVEDKHVFGGTIWQFTKAEAEGVSFSPVTGQFIDCPPFGATATTKCDDDLGQELDLFYNYYVSNNFGFDVAWSFYDPGTAVEEHWCGVGPSACTDGEGSDMAWRLTAQARARF